ncbi:MAG: hypothetical protein DWP98_01955 [Bacteroidetes bacterium]|nr:MAG: hypothetical protein DWP98_01955 [Bacteroidota bacterium]MBL1145508.1 hypothetical protein [Bacteroidota bacterium]
MTDSDVEFNPYEQGDILIFTSDEGNKDTVIIHSTMRSVLEEKCYSFIQCIYSKLTEDTWEGFYVNTNEPNQDWTGTSILTIRAEKNGTKTAYFDINIEGAWWYTDCEDNIEKLRQFEQVESNNGQKTFTDVIIIPSLNNEYRDRSNFIAKLYWSLSEGLVGLEKLNGKTWRIEKK